MRMFNLLGGLSRGGAVRRKRVHSQHAFRFRSLHGHDHGVHNQRFCRPLVSHHRRLTGTSWCSDGSTVGCQHLQVRSFGNTTPTTAAATGATDHPEDGRSASSSKSTRVRLPTLGQNGTLVIRSNDESIAQVQIVSQWRDDALLELLPITSSSASTDATDSGDDTEGDYSEVATFDGTSSASASASEASTKQTFGKLQLTNHADGVNTSMGRKGALVEVDVNANIDVEPVMLKLIATIPEKCNITCQLSNGGDIDIPGKVEGDVHLTTANGNISVSKLRGHNVTLDTTTSTSNRSTAGDNGSSCGGVIHVRKAIEARTVKIDTHSRVRARMLNGSDVSINVVRSDSDAAINFVKLDDDDEGASIDVGSIYVSNGGSVDGENEARLVVDDSNTRSDSSTGLVRVKSSHGHVTVHAKAKGRIMTSRSSSESMEQSSSLPSSSSPLVDLGGVNGSCDITLEAASSSSADIMSSINSSATAMRVHFDSMAPESISTITSRGRVGNASITMDRKLEADVRLLSIANKSMTKEIIELPFDLDAHSLTSDEPEDIRSVLMDLDADARVPQDGAMQSQKMGTHDNDGEESKESSILIETDAYRGKWGLDALISSPDEQSDGEEMMASVYDNILSPGVEYAQGTMKNRSGEPDSRYDVRSRGKINIDGAASQALHGFQGKQAEGASPATNMAPPMPLLAVATDGEIKLETLSWFGSIARRYGLEEEESGTRGVGRQASRKPRVDKYNE